MDACGVFLLFVVHIFQNKCKIIQEPIKVQSILARMAKLYGKLDLKEKMMGEKVKCKICGKVGLIKDDKGLIKHLRLIHNLCVSKKFDKNHYYEPADSDSIIEIKGDSIKSFKKAQNTKWRKYMKCSNNRKLHKNQYVRIIYTPMSNG